MSVGPIMYHEIEAWDRMMHVGLCPSEVRLIVNVDDAFRSYHFKKTNPDKAISGSNISLTESLDAMIAARDSQKERTEAIRKRLAEMASKKAVRIMSKPSDKKAK